MEKQKLIYVESKALFSPSEVSDKAIVFIKDTKEIWTHGTYFICSNIWTTPITLTLSGDSTGSVSIDGSGNVTLSVTNKYLAGTDGITDANNAVLATNTKIQYYTRIISSASNLFPRSNNANAILTLNTHDYTYNHQLGFSSNKGIYHRTRAAGTWETSWSEILTSTNYTKYPHTFASLTNKPTTISGYGITNSIPIIKGGSVTTDTDLSTLGMTTTGAKLSVFHLYTDPYPSWLNVPYMNVLMFRSTSDSYGAIGIEMMGGHTVQFVGGRNTETSTNNTPNWWYRIKGNSGTTYDLNSFLNTINNLDSNYLRKSGGIMTGNIILTTNSSSIHDSASSYGLLGANLAGNTTTGLFAEKGVYVGKPDSLTTIRSNGDDLWHYRNSDTSRYKILDASNYTAYALPLTGGTLTNTLILKAGAFTASNSNSYSGGRYQAVSKPNIRLIGDSTYGLSTIEFTSLKGDTSINKPSDSGFIQFLPYGVSALSSVGSHPTLKTSGESNALVLGVTNDSDDIIVLQSPSVSGLRHACGATEYYLPHITTSTTTANKPLVSTTTAHVYTLGDEYLPLKGGTMTGKITLWASNADAANTGGLNANNSNIYGLNSLYFADASKAAAEGINFYRSSTTVDSLWGSNGNLYWTPNRTYGSAGTNYYVLTSNNYSTHLNNTYLPLSGGVMTGLIRMTRGSSYLTDTGSGYSMLGMVNSGTTTVGMNSEEGMFINVPFTLATLRTSGNNLWHYNHANLARYLILDANNYTNYTIPYSNSNVNSGALGAFIHNGNLLYNNNFKYLTFFPSDNLGNVSYVLIAKLDNWTNTANATSHTSYGINGLFIAYRGGNMANTGSYFVTNVAYVNTNYKNYKLYFSEARNYILVPQLVIYLNEYYLAFKKDGSSTDYHFYGQVFNILPSFIYVNDASLITLVSGPSETATTGLYYYNNGNGLKKFLHEGNYSNYTLPLRGGTLTGILRSTQVAGNLGTSPIVCTGNVNNTSGINNTYSHLASNLAASGALLILIGKTSSTYNACSMGYLHRGDGSNTNAITLGLYGANNLLIVQGNGNVGIGNTSPSYKLSVNGDIYSSGYIRAKSGFIKTDSSNSYVLLGGGGHKLLSDLSSAHTHDWSSITSKPSLLGAMANPIFYPYANDSKLGAYISTINNRFYSADLRYTVTTTNLRGDKHLLFDDNYDGRMLMDPGTTATITIEGYNFVYNNGYIILYFYLDNAYPLKFPKSITAKATVLNGTEYTLNRVTAIESGNTIAFRIGLEYLTKLEFTIVSQDDAYCGITNIDYFSKRTENTVRDCAVVTKYNANTLYHNLTAPKYIVKNGTSSQFLKADGSLDSTSYLKVDGTNGTADGVSTLLNKLTTGTSNPQDADYYICLYTGGATATTTYHRRPTSALYSYIRAKLYNSTSNYFIMGNGDLLSKEDVYSIGSYTAVKNSYYTGNAMYYYWYKIEFPESSSGSASATYSIMINDDNNYPRFSHYILNIKRYYTNNIYGNSYQLTHLGGTSLNIMLWIANDSTPNLYILCPCAYGEYGLRIKCIYGTNKFNPTPVEYNKGGVASSFTIINKYLDLCSVRVNSTGVVTHTYGNIIKTDIVGNVTGTSSGNLTDISYDSTNRILKLTKNGTTTNVVTFGTNAFSSSKYAGSSSDGGAATSANKLNTNAGNSTTPVYFSNGIPVACTAYSSASVNKANLLACPDKRNNYPALIVTAGRNIGASFMAASKLGISGDGSYYDALIIRGYSDSSGGSENALLFSKNTSSIYHSQYAFGSTTTWGTLYKFLDSDNYKNYAPSLSGEGASGTWGINISGTANKVANALTLLLNGGTASGTNKFIYDGSAAYTVNITPASIGAAASSHNHDGSYLKLAGGTLGSSSASYTELRTLSSTAALRIMSYSDSTNYILSGNSSFDGNATLKITGYSNVTGTNLYFKFSNIYCRENDYVNIDSGNYGSYALPLSGGTMTGTINTANIYPKTNAGFNIGSTSSYYNTMYAYYFKKYGSDDNYLLLGGGGHKKISDFLQILDKGIEGGSSGNTDNWVLVLNNNYSTGWYGPCTMFYIRSKNFGCGILCFYHYWNTEGTSGYYDNSVWFFGAEHSAYSGTMGGIGRDINNYLKVYIDKLNADLKIYYNRYNNLALNVQELLFVHGPSGTLYPSGELRASHFINSTLVVELPTTSNTFVNIPILTVKNHTEDIKTTRSVYASAFYENSDIRLKENVHSIDLIDLLKNVDLVLFNFKNDLNKKYGVIAQQLEQVGLNNLVYEHNGNKAVDYISLLVLETLRLRNEIKELKEKLDKKELSS